MHAHNPIHFGRRFPISTVVFLGVITTWAEAAPTFVSTDPRLPNPDQPYLAEGDLEYGIARVRNFKLWATNPSQLEIPTRTSAGDYGFFSGFDVAFTGSYVGGISPPLPLSGFGTAMVRGFAPSGTEPNFVFDTELVGMNLIGSTPIGQDVRLRESPTLLSRGVTTVEGGCYGVCPPIVLEMRISSFFDVFTELSLDAGRTWAPSVGSTRIVQTPEPASLTLITFGAILTSRRRGRRNESMHAPPRG